MQEQFEKDIKQVTIQRGKVLAVMLLGKPVTNRDIKNYIHKRTGLSLGTDSISSLSGMLAKGPLKKYITITKHGAKFSYHVQEHPFKTTSQALDWECAEKKKAKRTTEEEPKQNPLFPDKEEQEAETKKINNAAKAIKIELPQITITIEFK